MSFHQEPIFQFLAQYAYEPQMVYIFVFGMMIASGFGFPMPEEVTILSVGILTYMGANPDLFPPPYEGAPTVHGIEAAMVTLFSVLFADCLVFALGRVFGRKLMNHPRFSRLFPQSVIDRINGFVKKYGVMAAFVFRFTPGIRFPAHIILGMSHFSKYYFVLVDGVAALISVPTQILLIYYYGEPILKTMSKFKIGILVILGSVGLFFLIRKLLHSRMKRPLAKGADPSV